MLYQSSELFGETDWVMFYDVTVACWMEQWRPEDHVVHNTMETFKLSRHGTRCKGPRRHMLSHRIIIHRLIETSHWDSHVKYFWHIALSKLCSSGLWWPGCTQTVNSFLRLLQYECHFVFIITMRRPQDHLINVHRFKFQAHFCSNSNYICKKMNWTYYKDKSKWAHKIQFEFDLSLYFFLF